MSIFRCGRMSPQFENGTDVHGGTLEFLKQYAVDCSFRRHDRRLSAASANCFKLAAFQSGCFAGQECFVFPSVGREIGGGKN